MQYLNRIISIITLLLILQSCEKVVDIDLEESPPQIVIEATLKAGTNDFIVNISKTSSYFGADAQRYVENANIQLTDDRGMIIPVPHIDSGQYIAEVTATVETNYTLEVVVDGNTYVANSYLPKAIDIVEIITQYEEGIFGDESGYEVLLRYNDPVNVPNYYRVIHSVNGVLQNQSSDLQVMNDDFNDGVFTKAPLLTDVFTGGDTIDLELIHFDRSSFEYFNSLISIIGEANGFGGGIAAPGNPNTNWSGDALGYFSAYSSDIKSVVLPE